MSTARSSRRRPALAGDLRISPLPGGRPSRGARARHRGAAAPERHGTGAEGADGKMMEHGSIEMGRVVIE